MDKPSPAKQTRLIEKIRIISSPFPRILQGDLFFAENRPLLQRNGEKDLNSKKRGGGRGEDLPGTATRVGVCQSVRKILLDDSIDRFGRGIRSNSIRISQFCFELMSDSVVSDRGAW